VGPGIPHDAGLAHVDASSGLGGGHGGASLAHGNASGANAPAQSHLGGGHGGSALANGAGHGPAYTSAPPPDGVGQLAGNSLLDGGTNPDAGPALSGGEGVIPGAFDLSRVLGGGLGSAGLSASALARAESSEWDERYHCRVCRRPADGTARFCGYCGEALERTLT